jgi:hypothetical protein
VVVDVEVDDVKVVVVMVAGVVVAGVVIEVVKVVVVMVVDDSEDEVVNVDWVVLVSFEQANDLTVLLTRSGCSSWKGEATFITKPDADAIDWVKSSVTSGPMAKTETFATICKVWVAASMTSADS